MVKICKRFNHVDKLQETYIKLYPEWRRGQCYFNALNLLYPIVADEVRGVNGIDPFYVDNNIVKCIKYISE